MSQRPGRGSHSTFKTLHVELKTSAFDWFSIQHSTFDIQHSAFYSSRSLREDPTSEDRVSPTLRRAQHVEKPAPRDLAGAEGAHVGGHDLAVEPGCAARAEVIDQEGQGKL